MAVAVFRNPLQIGYDIKVDTCNQSGCDYTNPENLRLSPVAIVGYDRKYLITNHGWIWSTERKIWLKSKSIRHDYRRVLLCAGPECRLKVVAHKLVFLTYQELAIRSGGWLGEKLELKDLWDNTKPKNDRGKWQIDHHDQNTEHNCITNLRLHAGSQTQLGYQKGERRSKLAPWKDKFIEWHADYSTPLDIHTRLRRAGVNVSESAVRQFIKKHCRAR